MIPDRSTPRRVFSAAVATALSVAWLWLAGLVGFAADQPVDLSQHTPRFEWRTEPSGEHWIYDGPLPVGAFYAGTEPLGSIAKPISLHDLRLLPGGPVFIRKGEGCGPLCLSWRKHLIFQMAVDALEADDSDPERFRLYVKTHDVALRSDQPEEPSYRPDNVVEETWLELTYDRSLPSYVLDVRTRLTVNPERREAMLARDFRGLEFGDLLPAGANDRFPPRGRKRFPWLVYRARDGRLYKLPQTHHLNQGHIEYAPDGFLAFAAEPDYNPVLQFVGESGLCARSEVCWAMYDVHFKFVRERQLARLDTGRPLEVHYRVYSVPEATANRWLDEAEPDPALEAPQFRLPAFFPDRVNRFEPSDEYRVPSDFWFWRKDNAHCRWVWDEGYQSTGSLLIQRPSPEGQSAWQFDLIDSGHFPGFRLKGRYRVRARVRTEAVTGGVRLAWQVISPKTETEYSPSLQGTRGWTLLEMETADIGAGRQAAVRLIQEGAGQSWFDDLEVLPIP
ncbi:MAG: hypothetical protein ABIP48_17385 [Planctomycetota bacterium]